MADVIGTSGNDTLTENPFAGESGNTNSNFYGLEGDDTIVAGPYKAVQNETGSPEQSQTGEVPDDEISSTEQPQTAELQDNDVIEGGAGNDIVMGGHGDDNFVFRFNAESTEGTASSEQGDDIIADFGNGNDTLNLVGLDESQLQYDVEGYNTVLSWDGGSVTLLGVQQDLATLQQHVSYTDPAADA